MKAKRNQIALLRTGIREDLDAARKEREAAKEARAAARAESTGRGRKRPQQLPGQDTQAGSEASSELVEAGQPEEEDQPDPAEEETEDEEQGEQPSPDREVAEVGLDLQAPSAEGLPEASVPNATHSTSESESEGSSAEESESKSSTTDIMTEKVLQPGPAAAPPQPAVASVAGAQGAHVLPEAQASCNLRWVAGGVAKHAVPVDSRGPLLRAGSRYRARLHASIPRKEATMVFEVYAAISKDLAAHIPAESRVEQLYLTCAWISWEKLGSFDPDPEVYLKLQKKIQRHMAFDRTALPLLEVLQRRVA